MGDRLFTSDTHFGHRRIIELAPRPFKSVEEMDEAMIQRWNFAVGADDEVFHLGDFAFTKRAAAEAILSRLHGRKYLVRGNHDHSKRIPRVGFEWVERYKELRAADGRKIVLCHYPFDVWNESHYGALHLHGHSHGTLRTDRANRWDVGVDAWGFIPVSEIRLLESEAQNLHDLGSVDHHTPRANPAARTQRPERGED